jgi:hypothetical protein
VIQPTPHIKATPRSFYSSWDHLPPLAAIGLYLAFAAIVFVMHGPEPTQSIDHISYLRIADEIRAGFPGGDYWRGINSTRTYGVILAYLYDYTGSHFTSLKILLAGMTVAYLGAFQLFMSLATQSRGDAVLFSILSALFVSFGASIWGMTDFAASLNRTIIIPFVVLLVWFFFRAFATPWRYAIFPALAVLSLLHLSAFHVIMVFAAFEVLDFIFRRRFRINREVGAVMIAIVISVSLQWSFERGAIGTNNYFPNLLVALKAPPLAPTEALSSKEAWEIELFAFPWRNMPPSLATIATMVMSYGVIFLLACSGAVLALRSGEPRQLDRLMIMLAVAVLLTAYGLQTLLWFLRGILDIRPINLEEIRAINLLMIPSMYFAYRLYEHLLGILKMPRYMLQGLIAAAIAFQPILIVRALPMAWREEILNIVIDRHWIERIDAPRILYARTFLGLGEEGRRFYYSARPAIAWLERHAGPNDLVLTNANDFYIMHLKTLGTFLNVVNMDSGNFKRRQWVDNLKIIDRVLETGDTDQVLALARDLGASFAIVTWPVDGASYQDEYFTILRVTP